MDLLGKTIPIWVSLYPSEGIISDMRDIAKAIIGFDTKQSEHIFLGDLPSSDVMLKALLASAAIPLAFPRQELNGKKYVDGGIGGWRKVQGNTSVAPLVNFGWNYVIVSHLSDGSLWSRQDFSGTTILEVRPSGISRSGFGDLLDFNLASISSWIEQGYQDAVRCIEPVRNAILLRQASSKAEANRDRAIQQLFDDDFHIP